MDTTYTDSDLSLRYRELMAQSSAGAEQGDAVDKAFEDFFELLVRRVYASLGEVSTSPLPELQIHTAGADADRLERLTAEEAFTDAQGIHIGLGFVSRLDGAILALSAYLLENYLWQVSPFVPDPVPGDSGEGTAESGIPLGMQTLPLPSLTAIVDPDDFPAEALALYAAHLIPEAEAADGYQKRPFQMILEYLQERLFAGDGEQDRRVLARGLPKPPVDFTVFISRLDVDEAIEAYLHEDRGPYLLRLHLQLLLDGLFFTLAHEVAHYQFGHVGRAKDVTRSRQDEAAADSAALAMLGNLPGFQPRSLIILFNFGRQHGPEPAADHMRHPLAHNRLMILAEALLARSEGEALRADVNAGLALLPSLPEPRFLTFGWPDGTQEDVDVYLNSYTDMDYKAHLQVYIDRAPRASELEASFIENALLLAHLAYRIELEVRDRVDQGHVYARGGVGYHPTIRPTDLYHDNRVDTLLTRFAFPIPAPPEFCLKWPGAEFAVKKVELIIRAPDRKEPGDADNQLRFFYEPVELVVSDFLQTLPPLAQDPSLTSHLLVAARRYRDYGRQDESIEIYRWLYEQEPESLLYPDLITMTYQLMADGQIAEAAKIARWAVGPGRAERPGFHYVIAREHVQRNEAAEAFEEAFLEMVLFGAYGEIFDEARELSAQIASYSDDPVMAAQRDFMRWRDTGGQALEEDRREDAVRAFGQAREALLTAQGEAAGEFLFLHQVLSDVTLLIAELEGDDFDEAARAAEAVLDLRADFVPALMNLAEIALHQGNRQRARALWRKAHAISPFNSLVFDRREEFDYELS